MNKTTANLHDWSKEALFNKAQRYFEEMLSNPHDSWQFVLFSTFSLELLARASLSSVNIVLLAESNSWNHLYYALGHTPKINKFIPYSIQISEVFDRIAEIFPNEFTKELLGISKTHINRRNEELHTGSVLIDSLNSSTWLPDYYRVCEVLLKILGSDFESIIGDDESAIAKEMITASL